MAAVGFEPTPPKRLVPKTGALDHSATLPLRKRYKCRIVIHWRILKIVFASNEVRTHDLRIMRPTRCLLRHRGDGKLHQFGLSKGVGIIFKSVGRNFVECSSLLSSVAEHWSRKPGVVSSILTGGTKDLCENISIFFFECLKFS